MDWNWRQPPWQEGWAPGTKNNQGFCSTGHLSLRQCEGVTCYPLEPRDLSALHRDS